MKFISGSGYNQAKIVAELFANFSDNNYNTDWLNSTKIIEVLVSSKDQDLLKLHDKIPLLYKKFHAELEEIINNQEFSGVVNNSLSLELFFKVILNLLDKDLLRTSFFIILIKSDYTIEKLEEIDRHIVDDSLAPEVLQDILQRTSFLKVKTPSKKVSFSDDFNDSVRTIPMNPNSSTNSSTSSGSFVKRFSTDSNDSLELSPLFNIEKNPRQESILLDVEKIIIEINNQDVSFLSDPKVLNIEESFNQCLVINFKKQLKKDYVTALIWQLYKVNLLPCASEDLEQKIIELISESQSPFQLAKTLTILVEQSDKISSDKDRIKFTNKYIKFLLNQENPYNKINLVHSILTLRHYFQLNVSQIQTKIVEQICDTCRNPVDTAKALCILKKNRDFKSAKDRLIFTNKYLEHLQDLENPQRFARNIFNVMSFVRDSVWLSQVVNILKSDIFDKYDSEVNNINPDISNNISDKVSCIFEMYKSKIKYENYFKDFSKLKLKIHELLYIVLKSNDPYSTKGAIDKIIEASTEEDLLLNNTLLQTLIDLDPNSIMYFAHYINESLDDITDSQITTAIFIANAVSKIKELIDDDFWQSKIITVFQNNIIDDFDPRVEESISEKVACAYDVFRSKEKYENYFSKFKDKSFKILNMLSIVLKSSESHITLNAINKIIDSSYECGKFLLNNSVLKYLKFSDSEAITEFSTSIVEQPDCINESQINGQLFVIGAVLDDDPDIEYESFSSKNIDTNLGEDSHQSEDGSNKASYSNSQDSLRSDDLDISAIDYDESDDGESTDDDSAGKPGSFNF